MSLKITAKENTLIEMPILLQQYYDVIISFTIRKT